MGKMSTWRVCLCVAMTLFQRLVHSLRAEQNAITCSALILFLTFLKMEIFYILTPIQMIYQNGCK